MSCGWFAPHTARTGRVPTPVEGVPAEEASAEQAVTPWYGKQATIWLCIFGCIVLSIIANQFD